MTEQTELEHLRSLLDSVKRENDLMRKLLSDAARPGRDKTFTYQAPSLGSGERMAMLENRIDILDGFVQELAQDDCYGGCDEMDTCRPCRAKQTLKDIADWRYDSKFRSTDPPAMFVTTLIKGSFHGRVECGWNPREAKIHAAWAEFFSADWRHADRSLGMVLTEDRNGPHDWPTPRDWYVATSVVQWLVTAVGSSILEAAGWTYNHYDEDRATIEAKRAAKAEAEWTKTSPVRE